MIQPLKFFNKRQRSLIIAVLAVIFLISVVAIGIFLDEESISTNLKQRNSSPSLHHPFGTDW